MAPGALRNIGGARKPWQAVQSRKIPHPKGFPVSTNTINVQVKKSGEILVDGKAVADLAAVLAMITENASKPDAPMFKVVGDPECTIEVGKVVSHAHWAAYPADKLDARCWE